MKYLIIGGSAAGVSCAETLRGHDKKSSITLVSDEEFPLYSRCLLTYLIAGSINEDGLYFKDENFYKDNNIKTFLGRSAVSIDRKNKAVSLDDKTNLLYDKLLIATGAAPKGIDIPGTNKKGVFRLRKIDDARKIIAMLSRVEDVVVLGGGLIGLRDAYALNLRGKKVTVVVKSPQVLSQMADSIASGIIAAVLEKNGIKIMTSAAALEITGRDAVEEVLLDNGKKLKAEMVIIGKGVSPNTGIASDCNLEVDQGITADEFLKTSDQNIFAAGDVAQTYDITRNEKRINALWPPAVEQGGIAALNMLGGKQRYCGSMSMNSVDFFNLASISMGITNPREEGYEIISNQCGSAYKKIVLKGNKIVGMIFTGEIKSAGIIGALIKSGVDIASVKHMLLEDNFDYAKIMPLIKEFKGNFRQEEFGDTVITY